MILHSIALLTLVVGDLPIHTVFKQVLGLWRLDLYRTARESSCGASEPMKIGDAFTKTGSPSETVRLVLSSKVEAMKPENGRHGWHRLRVNDAETDVQIGTWTMIYDVGIQIKLFDGHQISWISKYLRDNTNVDVPEQSGNGFFDGFTTDSQTSQIGWYNIAKGGKLQFGCVSASKIDNDQEFSSGLILPKVNLIEKIPQKFSWGDPIDAHEKMTELDLQVPTQGDCGACYALSLAYLASKRYQIKTGHTHNFSPNSILACSYLSQGCAGGYPMLSYSDMEIHGISDCQGQYAGEERCMRDVERVGSFLGPSCTRMYARDYGYVGGCYGCADSEKIREELYYNGPVLAAIDVDARFKTYSGGIYSIERLDHRHHNQADMENSWERTNHAVVLVGYGIDYDQGEEKKYWIGRNSWGTKWGTGGYFKILRGENTAGVENQVSYIDVR